MSGFPKLVPAFALTVASGVPIPVGSVRSANLIHIDLIPGQATIRSEPGYPIKFDAVLVSGQELIRPDADGRHTRLEVSTLYRDGSTGANIRFAYNGTAYTGPGAKSTEFGTVFVHANFETDHEALRDLGGKIYVGSARLVIEEGKPNSAEFKFSEVVG